MAYGMKINLTWGYCSVNLAHIIERLEKKLKKKYEKYAMQGKKKVLHRFSVTLQKV